MLDEYIKELIASNNRVIIPNFGAFLLRATSKNKNKKDLASKVEDIYFSPFLKFNDELLVNHIMKKKNLDQQAAMNKINQYVKEIDEKVAKEGSYKIEGLGEFNQDDQGKIQFKVSAEAAKEAPKEGPKEKSKEEEKPTESKKTEEKPPSKPKTVQEKAAEARKASAQQSKKEEPKKEDKPKEPEKQPQAKERTQKTPKVKTTSGKTASKKSDSNKGLILSIAIGVPVAVVFIWAMLNFDSVQNIFSKEGNNQEKLTEEVEDKSKEESKDKSKEQQKETQTAGVDQQKKEAEKQAKAGQAEKKIEKPAQPAKREKKFYIVAGSFKKKQNAVNFRKELIKKGYDSELIGERNGMHAVSYASFKSKNQANAELKKLREQGIQAWLLYY